MKNPLLERKYPNGLKINRWLKISYVHLLFLWSLVNLPGLRVTAQTVYKFDTPGSKTFVIPAGATRMKIEIWGSGGNGTTGANGFGGNAGDYYSKEYTQADKPFVSALTLFVGISGQYSSVDFGGDLLIAKGGRNDGTEQEMPSLPYGGIYRLGGKGGKNVQSASNSYVIGGGGGGGSANATITGGNGGDAVVPFLSISATPGLGGSGYGQGGRGGFVSFSGFGYGSSPGNSGSSPGGGGGGGKEPGIGGPGSVRITVYCESFNPGLIGNLHTIVYPQERNPDYVTSLNNYSGVWGLPDYEWQSSTDQTNWASTGQTSPEFQIPESTVQKYYRRSVKGCGAPLFSNVIPIKVLPRNGNISGYVRSQGGVGVKGIRVRIGKVTDLPGSPKDYIYTDTTNEQGYYSIPVYYGDIEETPTGQAISTQFWVNVFREGHSFNFDTSKISLTNFTYVKEDINFTDLTSYSITGRVFQKCQGCLDNLDQESTVESNLDGVSIYQDGKFAMKTQFLPSSNSYGSWAATVLNQGTYWFKPQMVGRQYRQDSLEIEVLGNVAGVNFEDTTTRLITGRIGDGCGVQIGEAQLLFQDVLVDKTGRLRASEFRKKATTVNGAYSVRLPARVYRVSVLSFTPKAGLPSPVAEADVKAFFNTNLDSGQVKTAILFDSLLADIRNGNAVRNLYYQRAPEISLEGAENAVCNSSILSFIEFPQSKPKPFKIKVWQGPKNLGCPLNDDSVVINTTIQSDDQNERRAFKVRNGEIRDTLVGGVPRVIGDYLKTFSVVYKDRYNRAVSLDRNVVVTGVKTDDASSFATTSPEVPMMVLHDPPGDQSYSFWETSQTFERAMSWSAASGKSTEGWLQVKLGTQFEAGLGVTTETEVWGSLNSSINVSSRTNNASESIITATTTQNISTSADEDVTGEGGDLFIGAALNLLYSRAFEVKLDSACLLVAPKRLMIAQNGFATQYVYTAAAIRDNVIPTLKAFVTNPGNSPEQTASYQNQVRVWEQVLANNEINKNRAAFDKNISFFGSSGPIANSTSSTVSNSSTIEFNMEIDAGLATELGLEVAGSGVSGGVNVHFKTEMGNSKTTTLSKATTIGYTLDDNDALDNFSVNVRRDPVYGTPVFQTVAGQSSCPPEESTLARDQPEFVVNNPEVTVPANEDAVFQFELGNISIDVNPRTYHLSFDQSSNPFGATVMVGGIPLGSNPIPYSIGQYDVVPVTVNVKRNTANNAYTYEGLTFYLSDACTGDVVKTNQVIARFTAPCSPITMVSPEENWVCKQSDNNLVSIWFKDYVLANLSSVSLEFCKLGSNNWRTGFSRIASQLNGSVNGTSVNWDVSNIADGQYYVRLKLTCASGVVYTQRVLGTIDRSAPQLVGVPQPSDAVYTVGDEISLSYNENLNLQNLQSANVSLIRIPGMQTIPVSVNGFANKLVVVPSQNLGLLAGEQVKMMVSGVQDLFGNIHTSVDSFFFDISGFVPGTGQRALQLRVESGNLPENSSQSMAFIFKLPVKASNEMQVNFSLSGSAAFGSDYALTYSSQSPLNVCNGSIGRVIIPKNRDSVIVYIKPLTDSQVEGAETIQISLLEGGDYQIGAAFSATGTIQNVGLEAPVISGTLHFCEGASTTLTASHAFGANPDLEFIWSTGDTATSIVVSTPGSYSVTARLKSTGLAGSSQPVEVTVAALPLVYAGADFSIQENSGNQALSPSPAGGTWTGTGISGNNFNSAQSPGLYTLIYCATNTDGCSRCDTLIATILPTPTAVATPVIAPGTGTYNGTQTVSITCPTTGAQIYYTTNGNTPVVGTSFTLLYNGPFLVVQTTTVRAIAVKSGLNNSSVAAAFLTISNPAICATPVISPGTGTFATAQFVSLSTTTSGAQLYYTTNGNVPVIGTTFTKLYLSPFKVSSTTTIRAIAVKTGFVNSPVAVATLTISVPIAVFVEAPSISPGTGNYSTPQQVSLSSENAEVEIYYSTNGKTPRVDIANTYTFRYYGPFTVQANSSVRAIAVLPGIGTSPVSAVHFSFDASRSSSERTAFGQTENQSDWLLYPNPSPSGKVFLKNPASEEFSTLEVRVFTSDGRQIFYNPNHLLNHELDLSQHPAGLYQVRIRTQGQVHTLRLQKD